MATIRISISDNHPLVTPDRWGYNETFTYFWYERDMRDGSRMLYMHPLANPQTCILVTLSPEEVREADARREQQIE